MQGMTLDQLSSAKAREVSQERKNRSMPSITPRKGQSFQLPGTIVTLLAIAADTGDSFSLFEGRVAPQQGIPLHRHTDDEAFLVLEGTFHFQIEDQQLQLGAGEFAFVSSQKRHRYFNRSAQEEGRLLVITLPAGNHERFFAEAGEPKASASEPISTQPPDIEKLVSVGKRYGIEILPPSSSSENKD
jgi:quercetin dioxygenase-like cupin family protein